MATAIDVIPLNSAKGWLNIDLAYTDEDAAVTRLIGVAIDLVEKYTSWRTFQRTEIVYNRQVPLFNPANYFPPVGSGTWNGSTGIKEVPGGLSIYLYPFTIVSVQDQSSPPVDVNYSTVRNALKMLLFALPNSVITLETGFTDLTQIPPPIVEAAYKWITYLYENRDMYAAEPPTDIQMLLNQYRRAII